MTDEISFDEARAREVRAVIAEFPQINIFPALSPWITTLISGSCGTAASLSKRESSSISSYGAART